MFNWLNEIGDSKVRLIVNTTFTAGENKENRPLCSDEYGIVLQDAKGAVRAFSWYTCTEISVVD